MIQAQLHVPTFLHFGEVLFVVGVLSLLGLGPAVCLLRDKDRPFRALWAPLLGVAVLCLLCLNASLLGIASVPLVWPLFGLGLIASFIAVWRGAVDRRVPDVRAASVIAMLSGLLLGWPGLIAGGDVYMAFANLDAFNYQMIAEYLRDHSVRDPLRPDGYRPAELHVYNAIHMSERVGADIILAWFCTLTGRTAKETYFFVLTAFSMLGPVSVYLFIRCGLNLSLRAARLGGVLAGFSSLASLIYYQQLLAHVAGAALAPALLTVFLQLLRRASIRRVLFAAVLLAAMIAIYPEMLYLLMPSFFVVVVIEYVTGRIPFGWSTVKPLLAAMGAACLLNPYYAYHAVAFLLKQSGGQGGQDTYAFLSTSWAWAVSAGLVPYFHPERNFLWLPYPGWVVLGVLATAGFGFLLIRSLRVPSLLPAAIGSIFTLLLGGWLLFARGYTYGAFKALLYGNFFLLSLIAGMAVQESGAHSAVASYLRRTLALVLFCNLCVCIWYGAQSLHAGGGVAAVPLSGDTSFRDLEAAVAGRPASERILVDVQDPARQLWSVYGLRKRLTGVRNPHEYLDFWSRLYQVPVDHGFQEELVLYEAGTRDIVAADAQSPIWTSQSMQLRELRDYVVLGRGWHGLERDSASVFRWLEKDGEILVARPSGPFQLAFDVSAGPGLASKSRTIDVYAGEQLIVQQHIVDRGQIVTPLVPDQHPVTPLRIHIQEDAGPLPQDRRVLNVRVQNVNVIPERLESAVPTGVFADGWTAPHAVVKVASKTAAEGMTISGEVPEFGGYKFPIAINLTCNGKALPSVRIAAPGRFQQRVAIPANQVPAGDAIVVLDSSFSFQPSVALKTKDSRRLSFRNLSVTIF